VADAGAADNGGADRFTAQGRSAPEPTVPGDVAGRFPIRSGLLRDAAQDTPESEDVASVTSTPGSVCPGPADGRDTLHAGPAVGIDDLERVMATHWQAPDREPLGDWLLRAAGGFTGRANSALTVGDPGLPVPEAIAAVTAWYAARRLPAAASVAGPSGPPLPDVAAHARFGEHFAAAGWRVLDSAGALVLTAALEPLQDAGPARLPGGLTLDLAAEPDPGWLGRYRYRGQHLPPKARELLLSAPEQVFCSIRDGARTVAVARGSLGGGWAGVTAVEVDPDHRRRGLARALLAAIARWGVTGGATSTYLQVGDANAGAIALYLGTGFTVHHRYDYLRYDYLRYDYLRHDRMRTHCPTPISR
jgi:GNAT superfamily N-acetyltransferase